MRFDGCPGLREPLRRISTGCLAAGGGEGREGEARGVVISRQELWRLQKRIVSFPSSSSSSSWRTTLRTLRVSSRVHERATFRSTRGGGGERGGQRFLARVLSTGRAFNESSFQRYPAGRKNAMFHTAAPVCRHPFLRGWKSSFSRPVDERTSPEIVYTEQIRGGSYSSIRAGIGFFFFINFTSYFKFVSMHDVKFFDFREFFFARTGFFQGG